MPTFSTPQAARSRTRTLLRRAGIRARQAGRLARWAWAPERWPSHQHHLGYGRFPHLLTEVALPMRRADLAADPRLEAGKQSNIAKVAERLDGIILEAGAPFSFWRSVGRPIESVGYTWGMALHAGCIVPEIAGGICLVTNALYEAAARSGGRILERHGHSREAVPPEPGRIWSLDATVAWPHIDLRFALRQRARLSVVIDGPLLRVALHGERPLPVDIRLISRGDRTVLIDGAPHREGELLRITCDPGRHEPKEVELIAASRRRILSSAQQRRSCLNCGISGCPTRPKNLPRDLGMAALDS